MELILKRTFVLDGGRMSSHDEFLRERRLPYPVDHDLRFMIEASIITQRS
jgi:hypothetical protein